MLQSRQNGCKNFEYKYHEKILNTNVMSSSITSVWGLQIEGNPPTQVYPTLSKFYISNCASSWAFIVKILDYRLFHDEKQVQGCNPHPSPPSPFGHTEILGFSELK